MTIVMGIDQASSGDAGLAVVDLALPILQQLVFTYVETFQYTDIKGKQKKIPLNNPRWRGIRLARMVQCVIQEYQPEIVCEELVRTYHRGVRDPVVVSALSEIMGALSLVIPTDIPIYRFNTNSWQRVRLGEHRRGREKELSIEIIKVLYGREVSEHEADAANIALAYPELKDDPNPNVTRIIPATRAASYV